MFPRLILVSNQTPKVSTNKQEKRSSLVINKKSSLDCKLVELLLYLETTTYINNICYNF